MSQTLHTSEKIHQAVLPQRLALESVSVDTPRVGTKQGAEAGLRRQATGMQHGRGETGNGASCPSRRNPPKTDEPVEAETGERKPTTSKPVATRVFVLDRHGKTYPRQLQHRSRSRNQPRLLYHYPAFRRMGMVKTDGKENK